MQKAIRAIAVLLVVGFLFALIIYNVANPAKPDMTAWNQAMTLGNKETAEHHFIMYTGLFCPYCDKFSDAVVAHQEEFERDWLEAKKIFFEIRMTDMNYASGHSNNSLPAAEGSYCAAKQEKFWDFYHKMLSKLWDDYHSKGIGVSKESERIPDLPMDYFYTAAKDAGLDEASFKSCMDNHETAKEVEKNTNRAANIIDGGVPYFSFGKFSTSGFAGNWNPDNDWEQVQLMLQAGLTTK